jgi:vacuolar protein sorting-associated protein 35
METAASIELFVEILDRYVYYFDQQNESVCFYATTNTPPPNTTSSPTATSISATSHIPYPGDKEKKNQKNSAEREDLQVTTKYLNGLIELIHSNLAGNQQDSVSVENSKKHFHQTLENIRSRQYEGVVLYPST